MVEKENTVEKFINKIKLLKQINVDVSKITDGCTIEEVARKSGISKQKLEEVGLNPTEHIGYRKNDIARSYRSKKENKKTKRTPPTEEQAKELAKLGIQLELIEKENVVEKFINKIKLLKQIGVDTSKITFISTIGELAKESEISEEKLKKVGLDPIDNIGYAYGKIAQNYRAVEKGEKAKGIAATPEQAKELIELGILLELRENSVEKFINTLKLLKEIGVDISKIVARDNIKSLAEKSKISEEKLKEVGLNPEDKIGNTKNNIAKAYRKKEDMIATKRIAPTPEQVQELLELGISLESKKSKNKIKQTVQENKENLAEAIESGAKIEEEILVAEKGKGKKSNKDKSERA